MKFKHLYLLLAIFGLAYTWYFNVQFYLTQTDTSITNFIALTKTTLPAQSIIADITVVVLTFLVAIAFSFPLFLYMRANRLETLQSKVTD